MAGFSRAYLPAFGLLAALAACGPVPVEQAERSCMRDAELAQRPRGEAAIGVGSDGSGVRPYGKVSIEVGSDYVMGRDPAQVFNNCVIRRSGQQPTRPLYDQPGWRG